VTTARSIVFDALLDLGVASNEEPMQAPMAEQGLRLLTLPLAKARGFPTYSREYPRGLVQARRKDV
jgi:hypothetical protein